MAVLTEFEGDQGGGTSLVGDKVGRRGAEVVAA